MFVNGLGSTVDAINLFDKGRQKSMTRFGFKLIDNIGTTYLEDYYELSRT
jgi:hypothetical protein